MGAQVRATETPATESDAFVRRGEALRREKQMRHAYGRTCEYEIVEQDWMRDGACFNNPEFTSQFFNQDQYPAMREKFCDHCEVRRLCYAFGSLNGEAGLWGGASERERDKPKAVKNALREAWPDLYAAWKERGRSDPLPGGLEPPRSAERPRGRRRRRTRGGSDSAGADGHPDDRNDRSSTGSPPEGRDEARQRAAEAVGGDTRLGLNQHYRKGQ